jgi:hypothetical protein
MDDSNQSPPPDHLRELLDTGAVDEAVSVLSQLETAPVDNRKAALQMLRRLADDQPADVTPLVSALTPFLTDPERPVRLSTAKLLVTLAAADSEAVVDSVPLLAERLADDDEFYYVRGRAAEAIGYVAVEQNDVLTPEILADLRIGIEFDEPEVVQKLSKALAYVALGDPGRLRHHADRLAEHLDSDDELVRYHLATAFVAVGCDHPDALSAHAGTLAELLGDDNPYVGGRAAEAVGLAAHGGGETAVSALDTVDAESVDNDAAAEFLQDRLRFAASGVEDGQKIDAPEGVGSLRTIATRTDGIVDAITTPDGEGCPNCGLSLPEQGPPTCPRCGHPY